MKSGKEPNGSTSLIDAFVLVLVFVISNRATWLCIFEVNKILFSCEYGHPTDDLLLYTLAAGFLFWLVLRRDQGAAWGALWKKNWILGLFLAVSFASIAWSIGPNVTLFKSLLITVSAIVASYLGFRYGARDWISFIVYFGVFVIILSYVLVAVLPGTAIMSSPRLVGDWRGAFSHKNYLGSIVAYCSAALLYTFMTREAWGARRILFGVTYLASVVLLVLSKSATGLILLVLLSGFTAGWLSFRKWRGFLTRAHYVLLGAGSLLLIVIGALNSGRILAMFGRDSNLTGRLPFWRYLLDTARLQHLWLGYGLGALWYNLSFHLKADADMHGSFPIINAHSGYLEVFLSLGLLGLFIFLAVVALAIYRIWIAVGRDADFGYWAIVTTAYVLITNITTSFFFQFETFHWVLLIVVLFMATRINLQGNAAGRDGDRHLNAGIRDVASG